MHESLGRRSSTLASLSWLCLGGLVQKVGGMPSPVGTQGREGKFVTVKTVPAFQHLDCSLVNGQRETNPWGSPSSPLSLGES